MFKLAKMRSVAAATLSLLSITAGNTAVAASSPTPRIDAYPSRMAVIAPKWGQAGAAPADLGFRLAAAAAGCTIYSPSSTTTPSEIVELSRALKWDPTLIFQYVHDQIEYDPTWGSLKGAWGTLLDGRGGAFDQSSLLVALLNEAANHNSAISGVQFVQGTISLSGTQLASWIRTDTDINSINGVFSGGGFPAGQIQYQGSGTTVTEASSIPHVWVQATVSGKTISFDPAFKQYAIVTGINIASAMGYTQSAFTSSFTSGATTTAASVQLTAAGTSAASTELAQYSQSLGAYIKQNYPTADLKAIIGGGTITPVNVSSTANFAPISPTVTTTFTTIPSSFRADLAITVQGASCEDFYSSDIYGQRLSITAATGGAPALSLNGASIVTSGSTFVAGAQISVAEVVDLPWQTNFNQARTQIIAGGSTYVIMNGWDQVGRGMIEKHQRLLAQNTALGNSPSSEPVLGESLNTIGYNWLAQIAQRQRIADQIQNVRNIYLYGVGIVGQSIGPSTQGPYVDLPLNFVNSPVSVNGSGSGAIGQEITSFINDSGVASGFEAGVLRQVSQTATNGVIASTTAILNQAMLQQLPIYDMNSSNFSTYSAKLGWTSTNLANLQCVIAASPLPAGCTNGNPYRAIAPAAPSGGLFSFGNWKGVGFKGIYTPGGGTYAETEQISGGLSGGFPGNQIPPSESLANQTASNPSNLPDSSDTSGNGISNVTSYGSVGKAIGDPIDPVAGSFNYSHDDLTTGSRPFPYGLGLQRIYSSAASSVFGPFGYGWTHNFNYSVANVSDPFAAMGGATPQSAASVVVASYVSADLLSTSSGSSTPTLTQILGAVFTNQWMIDRLVLNAESVTKPDGIEHFVKIPPLSAGAAPTFSPPVGSATILTQAGTVTTYQGKDGISLLFDSSKDPSSVPGFTHITEWQNAAGAQVNFTWDSSGFLTDVKNNVGRELTLNHGSGLLYTSASDVPTQGATAHSVSYGYNTTNTLLLSFTDALSQKTTFSYNASGPSSAANNNLTQVFYPSGGGKPFVTNTYDSLGRVMQQLDGRSEMTQAYLAGSRTELVNPNGVRSAWYFDSAGRVTSTIRDVGGLNLTITNQYDGQGDLIRVTQPEGDGVAMTYDSLFNPLVISRFANPATPVGKAGTTLNTVFSYQLPVSSLGNFEEVLTSTDPNQNATTYHYDSAGSIKELDQPAVTKPGVSGTVVPKSFATFNSVGLPVSKTDAEGRVTEFTYSPSDPSNAIAITRDYGRLNLKTANAYDGYGNLITITDPNGHNTNQAYDADRNRTAVSIDSSGNNGAADILTNFTFDSEGRLLTSQRYIGSGTVTACAGGNTSFLITKNAYDLAGNLSTVTDPLCHTTTTTYDPAERLQTVTNPENHQKTYAYDNANRLTTVSDSTTSPAVLLEAHAWGNDGEETGFKDANGNVTTFGYDGYVRMSSTTYPGGSASTRAYDFNGNLKTLTTRAKATITYTYDALNRLLTKTPAAELAVTYGYDETGLPLTISDSNGTFTLAYDTAGRKAQEVKSGNARGAFTALDAAGNLTQLKWADGYAINFTYDGANRLKTVVEPSTTVRLANYGYDNLSRRTSLAYGNGANTAYGYDNGDNLTSEAHNLLGATGFTFIYGYNTIHQQNSRTAPDQWTVLPPTSSVTYGVNTLNQYKAVGSVAPTYDGDGNLTGDGTFTYGYDTENRLVSASGKGHTLAFVYDAEGRLGTTTLDSTATSFDYAGIVPMGDWTGTGFATGQTELRRHVFAGGQPLYLTVNGVASYVHLDALGSVVALSTSSGTGAGDRSANFAYDAFGNPNSAVTSVFGYSGQRIEPTTGLIYDQARFYSPALGRFLQTDPIGYKGGNNLYAYVNNDPLNLTDPSGLYLQQAGSAAWGLTKAGASYAYNNPLQTAGIVAAVAATVFQPENALALPEEIAGIEGTTAAAEEAGVAARGLGQYGGIFSSSTNAAGGEVWTSVGEVSQNDFASIVNSGLMKGGDVNILTGVHGFANGEIAADLSLYNADVATFGRIPGVNIYNIPEMTPGEIGNVLNGPGTTIGGFCNSGACLAPFR